MGMDTKEMDMETKALKSTLLTQHEVRNTDKQKRAFIDWALSYAAQREIPVCVEESGNVIRSRNIVFGDVEHAHTIIAAHYDTPAWTPMGAGMTPGCWPVILLIELVQTVFLLPLMIMMFFGFANPHTANDNTSGVLTLLLAMDRFQGRRGVAYVLFDNEEKGLLGSRAFIKAHPQAARRFLLNLDCVGDGGTLLYTGTKLSMRMPQAKRFYAALEKAAPGYGMRAASGLFPRWLYPSDQMLFPRGTAVAALKGRRILYIDRIHTARDTVLEERNVDCLLEAMQAL